jgi:DNA invertase Pin-like site-specific DNA recombinase
MIACYCRASSRRPKTDSQKAEITRWLTRQGVELSAVQWVEDIETGMTMRRAAFAQMQRAIFAKTVNTVVVWKLDRLSRRQHEGITLLVDWCERDVRVVVVTQQIDLRGAVGRMVASVLFGLAEIETEYRQERQAAGIAVAKKRGRYRGRQQGTTKARPRRATVLRPQGLTVPEIAKALQVSPLFTQDRPRCNRYVQRTLTAMPPVSARREPSTRGKCGGPARGAAAQGAPLPHTNRLERGTMPTQTIYANLNECVTLVCAQCRRSKTLEATVVKDLTQPLTVKCPCGATFGVHIIIRRFYRKKTRLPGVYVKRDPQTGQMLEQGRMLVEDISWAGLGLRTQAPHSVRPNEVLTVTFALDDPQHTRIQKAVQVRRIDRCFIGAEFLERDAYTDTNRMLGFYMMPQ